MGEFGKKARGMSQTIVDATPIVSPLSREAVKATHELGDSFDPVDTSTPTVAFPDTGESTVMPDAASKANEERRAALRKQKQRRGRASTIMTMDDKGLGA